MSITAKEAPSLFSSLPNDIVLNILARVPRRYYPILSCVSNKLRSLLHSSELHKTRSLMGKNCFYVCFVKYGSEFPTSYHWFSLTEDRRLVSIHFPSPTEPYSAALMVSHEIYFVGGSISHPSKNLWILDSRSGKLRLGPSSLVATRSALVRLVDDKIFVFGGRGREIEAQVFDLKTQTWQIALNPITELQYTSMQSRLKILLALGKKKFWTFFVYNFFFAWAPRATPRAGPASMSVISLPLYARDTGLDTIFYDLRDCYELKNTSKDFCVVENVIYIYNSCFGLMWYRSIEMDWRMVQGLKLNKYDLWNLKMAEYDGKLAILWHETKKMELWCAMISLCRRGVEEIQGEVEWSNCLLSNVPLQYNIIHCLCRAD